MGETGSCSDGQAMLSKPLIQFSVDGRGCVSSLLFNLKPNYGESNEENGDLLQKVLSTHCCTLPLTPKQATTDLETPGHSQANVGQSLVGSL